MAMPLLRRLQTLSVRLCTWYTSQALIQAASNQASHLKRCLCETALQGSEWPYCFSLGFAIHGYLHFHCHYCLL